MNKFEQFSDIFNSTFQDVGEFILKSECNKIPLGGQLIENLDEDHRDSYGNEYNSELRRIFYFPFLEIYIEFRGTRSSYSGKDWDEYREVIKKEKIITTWEEQN